MHLLANQTKLVKQWDDPTDYFQSSTYMEVSKKYYSLVDRDILRKVYQRYKLDFDMFGYSPDEYIAMGKPGPDEIEETTLKQAKKESSEQAEAVGDADATNNGDLTKDSEIVKPSQIIVDPVQDEEQISKLT